MKKFLSVALALALALTVVAPVATSAATTTTSSTTTVSGYAFSGSSLTVGSRGADVVTLQSFLEAKGLLTIPAGVAKGYFGGLTRSAVSAYQVMKGIVPTAGYFGPITRAAVMADVAAMSNTTTTTTTGTTTTVAGCPAGALYNTMTAAPCTTTTTTTTSGSGVEGTLDVRLASNPADNSNIRTQTDVPVYGLEFRARIGDVTVQTVDLKVVETASSTSENPATLINTIKVWDGSNVIATFPVSLSTFTRDQSQVYYYRISGLNFLVPKDVTKTLTFSFSTNSIDTDRSVVISGYNSASVRSTSGNNISSFYDASALTRTHVFKKPGTSSLELSAAGNTLRSQNYRVNGVDTLMGVTLGTFNLISKSGASTLLTVTASTTASGTAPTTLYLYNGSTLLKSKTLAAGTTTVSFDNLDTTAGAVVPQSETPTTFTIKADFLSNTVNGTAASTTITAVVFQTPNGNTANATGNGVINAPQYVYTKAAAITLAGTPTITAQNAAFAGGTSTVTATFPLSFAALGGNVVLPTAGDFTVTFSNGASSTLANTSVVVIPNNDIANGSSASVTVTAKLVNPASGLYNAAITQIKWNAGNGTTTQTYGFEDFKTSSAANVQ